jgi:hypothetical protein
MKRLLRNCCNTKVPYLALKMETICFSETLISTYESTRRHNPKEQPRLYEDLNFPYVLISNVLFGLTYYMQLVLCNWFPLCMIPPNSLIIRPSQLPVVLTVSSVLRCATRKVQCVQFYSFILGLFYDPFISLDYSCSMELHYD